MLTSTPFTVTSGRLAAFFKTNENELISTLNRVASGKRVQSPFDNITDYFHAKKINRESSDYERIRTEVAETSAMLDVGVNIGEKVFANLSKMRQLVDDYYDPNVTQDEKDYMKAEFTQLIDEVNASINNGLYDGKKIVQDTSATGPLKKVYLDSNDLSQTFSITFTAAQVANPSMLTLGSGDQNADISAVQAELDKAGSYLATVSAYARGIKSHYNIINQKIETTRNTGSAIINANESIEMAKATERSIRHQSTAAMIAQANMARASVLKLLQF